MPESSPVKKNKIAIIGAGASGLQAAIMALDAGAEVHLFEMGERVGRKILASGNGRCNISNTSLSSNDYFGESPSFVAYALEAFGFKAFESFCRTIGLLLHISEDGRVYPRSNEAKAVTLAYELAVQERNVSLNLETKVSSIFKNGSVFELILNDGQKKHFSKVLIATGSIAAPQLGVSEDGLTFAESFGHTVIPPHPSLVQLHLDVPFLGKTSGIKQVAHVTLYVNRRVEGRSKGDILFTNYGISGFAILDLSQKAVPALLQDSSVELGLNLLPEYDFQKLTHVLSDLCKNLKERSLHTLLSTLIPSRLVSPVLNTAKIDGRHTASEMNTKSVKQLANVLSGWRLNVTDSHGFKHAEACGGGVDTREVDSNTMESRKTKGLYFSGEVLDVVGRRGGYNLHFAWASGYLAGKHMAKKE